MIEAGAVAMIQVSEQAGNAGRIVDVVGKFNDECWIVKDGLPFNGYARGTHISTPIEKRRYVESQLLVIEGWKLRRVY